MQWNSVVLVVRLSWVQILLLALDYRAALGKSNISLYLFLSIKKRWILQVAIWFGEGVYAARHRVDAL